MASPTKKRVRIATAEVLADRSGAENIQPIDWMRCCLCQRHAPSMGTLKCPAVNLSKDTRLLGYKSMAELLAEFNAIGHLPSSVRYAALSEGGRSVVETLIERAAKWHKACELKVNRTELARVKDRRKKMDALTEAAATPLSSPVKRRLTRSVGSPALSVMPLEEKCFICGEKGTWSKGLCKVSTVELEQRVAEVEEKTADVNLKAQLAALRAGGSLRAQESRYHTLCLANLYKTVTVRQTVSEAKEKQSVRACEAIAFADVLASIDEKIRQSGTDFVFPMSVITKSYQQRLANILGVDAAALPAVHTTRLREKIVDSCPHLRLERPAHEYVFVKGNFAPVLIPQHELDRDVVAFKRFVREIRTEMVDNSLPFAGALCREEQAAGTPATLGAVNMMLYGPSAADMDRATQPALSLTQLLQFNLLKRQPRGSTVVHLRERETALPVYLSLSTYARSRSKEAITELHALGLGISAQRVYEITSSLCHLTVKRAEEEGFLCPAELRRGLFTIAALDNVDHNPSSSTAQGSFHGTGISVFQIPTKQCPGEPRAFQTSFSDVPQSRTDLPNLPENYAVVPSTILKSRKPASSPALSGTLQEEMTPTSTRWDGRENRWLNHVREVVQGGEYGLDLSWGAFHATHTSCESDAQPIINTLLPLFHEVSETPSMVKHGFTIVTKITNMVNAGQTPVLCMDQPLFALGKILQCNWPQTHGENKMVLLMGGLHIEQAFLRLLGSLMDECGWAEIAAQAGIASEAGAEALLKVHNIKRSRSAHEATAAALYSLLCDAHTELCDTHASVVEWAEEQSNCPTFYFWWTVLKLEILLLSFVGSLRSASYDRYLASIRQMLPWFFSWDKINYARWLSVHLKDLIELPLTAPDVATAFSRGFFSLAKTRNPFSKMSPDQVHEQNNKLIKGEGGAIGLTENRESLLRWMLAGPEVQKLVNDFSPTKYHRATENLEIRNDQYTSFQTTFKQNVDLLIQSFMERGNPFIETGSELINIHTRDVLGPDAVKAVTNMESEGMAAYRLFVSERLIARTRSLFDPIKKNNRKVFTSHSKNIQGNSIQIKSLQIDAQLFLQLYIISEHRQLDLNVFFSYENQVCPPSVSKNGDLRLPESKSDILSLMIDGVSHAGDAPETRDCLVFDASIISHVWPPRKSNTFSDYWLKEIRPNLMSESAGLRKHRLDLAWDQYSPSSLKRATRNKRGTSGTKKQVLHNTLIPKNWKNFLQNDENKAGLCELLAEYSLSLSPELLVVTNVGSKFAASQTTGTQLSGLPSLLEEADARLILHAADAARNGCESIVIRTVDSDVVVLAVSYYFELRDIGATKIWIDFGVDKHRRYFAVHEIAKKHGKAKANAIRGFHAFTGCDTTSTFHTKGKKSAWKIWTEFPEATPVFQELSDPVWALSIDAIRLASIFVVRLYGGPNDMDSVDAARQYLFKECKKSLLDGLPPTAGVLLQHTLRSVYQGGYLWGQALAVRPELPSPEKWGWRRSTKGAWEPHWSDDACIWETCRGMLVKCGCQKGCKEYSCSCRKQRLSCTHFCTGCRGQCEQSTRVDADVHETEADCN